MPTWVVPSDSPSTESMLSSATGAKEAQSYLPLTASGTRPQQVSNVATGGPKTSSLSPAPRPPMANSLVHESGMVKQACVSCATGKRRCSGDQPTCERCRRLGKPCSYPTPGTTRVMPPAADPTGPVKRSRQDASLVWPPAQIHRDAFSGGVRPAALPLTYVGQFPLHALHDAAPAQRDVFPTSERNRARVHPENMFPMHGVARDELPVQQKTARQHTSSLAVAAVPLVVGITPTPPRLTRVSLPSQLFPWEAVRLDSSVRSLVASISSPADRIGALDAQPKDNEAQQRSLWAATFSGGIASSLSSATKTATVGAGDAAATAATALLQTDATATSAAPAIDTGGAVSGIGGASSSLPSAGGGIGGGSPSLSSSGGGAGVGFPLAACDDDAPLSAAGASRNLSSHGANGSSTSSSRSDSGQSPSMSSRRPDEGSNNAAAEYDAGAMWHRGVAAGSGAATLNPSPALRQPTAEAPAKTTTRVRAARVRTARAQLAACADPAFLAIHDPDTFALITVEANAAALELFDWQQPELDLRVSLGHPIRWMHPEDLLKRSVQEVFDRFERKPTVTVRGRYLRRQVDPRARDGINAGLYPHLERALNVVARAMAQRSQLQVAQASQTVRQEPQLHAASADHVDGAHRPLLPHGHHLGYIQAASGHLSPSHNSPVVPVVNDVDVRLALREVDDVGVVYTALNATEEEWITYDEATPGAVHTVLTRFIDLDVASVAGHAAAAPGEPLDFVRSVDFALVEGRVGGDRTSDTDDATALQSHAGDDAETRLVATLLAGGDVNQVFAPAAAADAQSDLRTADGQRMSTLTESLMVHLQQYQELAHAYAQLQRP